MYITAIGNTGGSASGFLWRYHEQDYAVTALHAVVGAKSIEVEFRSSGGRSIANATLERGLTCCDLALLQLGKRIGAKPFRETYPTENGQTLYAFDYRLNTPSVFSGKVRVENNTLRVRDRVPTERHDEIEATGVVSLDASIVSLDTSLAPGSSGAPIVDENGRLVAIGSGGLANGAGSVSWAIPAAKLAELVKSVDSLPTNLKLVSEQFASQEAPGKGVRQSISIAGQTMWLSRRATVGELLRTCDDPKGARRVVEYLAGCNPSESLEDIEFEVFLPENAHVAIALPADRDYQESTLTGLQLEFSARTGVPVGPGRDWELQRMLAERVFRTPAPWPLLSIQPVNSTVDGILYGRTFHQGPFPIPNKDGQFTTPVAFVSRVENQVTYLHMAAIVDRPKEIMTPKECLAWAKAVLAVHLSTIVR